MNSEGCEGGMEGAESWWRADKKGDKDSDRAGSQDSSAANRLCPRTH